MSSPEYKLLITYIQQRIDPNSLNPDDPCRQFLSVWSCLSISEDRKLVVYDSSKLLVPSKAIPKVLQFLHKSHCGFVKSKKLAQELYFWPHMARDIKNMVEGCPQCLRVSPSQQCEPLLPSVAQIPMEMVGVDLFQLEGKQFLCMVDRFSGFPFVAALRSLTTRAILKTMTTWFYDFGFPRVIRSDGGPQFRTEFEQYCRSNGITKELSSPYNPQSNGLAESAVKQVKYLMKKVGSTD